MIPASFSLASDIGSVKARLMYELCERDNRLVSLPECDWFTALVGLAWYLRLPSRRTSLPVLLLVPSQVSADDTVHNLSLVGVSARPVGGRFADATVHVAVSAKPLGQAAMCATHDVVVIHPAVRHLHPSLGRAVKAGKAVVLGSSADLDAQAPGLLASRVPAGTMEIPLELILAGAA